MALTDKLTDIADAIREKTSTVYLIALEDMPEAIRSISGGPSTDDSAFLNSIIDRSVTEVTDSDLAGVTVIGSYAFASCVKLQHISIPSHVTSIGKYAFYCCIDLLSANIPNSVASISEAAFSGTTDLTSITLPDSLTSIEKHLFSSSGLTSITIPERVSSIGTNAFYNCSKLESVTIPVSVTSIGSYAFYGCKRLTDVYYKGTEEQWNAITISSSNEALTNATIHYNS